MLGGAGVEPELHQSGHRPCRAKALEPLVPDPLGRELRQPGRCLDGRGPGGGLDGEPESRREAQRPEDAEVVLAEPLGRHADRPQERAVEIAAAVERIAPLVPERMVGDGVHGEIAARQVLVERDAVGHDGVAAVGDHVPAEGGHLVQHAPAVEHADGAVLLADRGRPPEQRGDLRRRGRGGEVVVGVRVAQQGVAERAPDAPGLVAGRLELARDLEHLLRDLQTQHGAHRAP